MQINLTFSDYDEMKAFATWLVREPAKAEAVREPEPKPAKPKAKAPDPIPEPEPKAEDPEPAAGAKAYTQQEVRAYLADLRKKGKKEEVHKLIEGMGFEKFTDIPEEKYPELMKKAEGL